LIHQNIVKLTDFCLSKRIEEVSESVIRHIEPKKLVEQKYKLNEMSDVYSVGVLLWEISSGHTPYEELGFYNLIVKIPQGFREEPIPDTPTDYVSLYTGNHYFKVIYFLLHIFKF